MYLMKLFFRIVKLRFLSLIEYPGSYVMGILAQWLSYGIEAVLIVLTVSRFGALAGWSPDEVIFLYAVWLLTYAIGASFTFNITRDLANLTINGTLDESLTRPVPSMFFLIATNFNLGYVSHMTLSLGVLIYAASRLSPHWGAGQWAWLVALVISGSTVTGCMMLLLNLPALRLKARSPLSVFFWEGRRFAQYPLAIYPRPLQALFASALPFGFIGYYPLLGLMGKTDVVFGQTLTYLSPVIAVGLVALTVVCWNHAIKRYESAGT